MQWHLENLKSQLANRKEVLAWVIAQEHIHRRERYFLSDQGQLATDQDRSVHSSHISVKLFVRLPVPGRHGEITKRLFPALPLQNQIDVAVSAALQTDHQSWELPTTVPKDLPPIQTTDARMAEDLDKAMEELSLRIKKTVEMPRTTRFDSAELFLSVHDRELHLSTGLVNRSSQSRVYTEAAFSKSDEYLTTHWAVNLDHLPIENLFEEASRRAEHSGSIVKPETGKYSVIVDAEVLSCLLNGYVSQLTASHAYNRLPFLKCGDEFIPKATGDLITMTLDPTLPFGADTVAISNQGLIQTPLKLVDANRVVATSTDKQYGDYLGLAPNTARGNIVVEAGSNSHSQLCQADPLVLEILQFSGLFADPNSGTFSSEIRLAKLYDNRNGKVTYLKGGSLSGSIAENFRGLKLSSNRVQRSHFSSEGGAGQGYFGPEFGLLTDVSIVG